MLLLGSCSDDASTGQQPATGGVGSSMSGGTGGAGASMSGGTGGTGETSTGGSLVVGPLGEPSVECETRPSCDSDVLGVWKLADSCGRRGTMPFPGCELASAEWDTTGIGGELLLKESGECFWSYVIEKTWTFDLVNSCGSCDEHNAVQSEEWDTLNCVAASGGCSCVGIQELAFDGTFTTNASGITLRPRLDPTGPIEFVEYDFQVCAGAMSMVLDSEEFGELVFRK